MLENKQKCLLRYKVLLNCLSGKTKLPISEKIGVILIFIISANAETMSFNLHFHSFDFYHVMTLCRETLSNTGDPCLISSPVLVLASSCSWSHSSVFSFMYYHFSQTHRPSVSFLCTLPYPPPQPLGPKSNSNQWRKESLFSPEGNDASFITHPTHTHTHTRSITLSPIAHIILDSAASVSTFHRLLRTCNLATLWLP